MSQSLSASEFGNSQVECLIPFQHPFRNWLQARLDLQESINVLKRYSHVEEVLHASCRQFTLILRGTPLTSTATAVTKQSVAVWNAVTQTCSPTFDKSFLEAILPHHFVCFGPARCLGDEHSQIASDRHVAPGTLRCCRERRPFKFATPHANENPSPSFQTAKIVS